MIEKKRDKSTEEGFSNTFNPFFSTVDVEVYSTEIHDFVLITEPKDNPGPSITNAAEFICPQICQRMGLDWNRCIFIESYPPEKFAGEYDPTYDRICFSGIPREEYSRHHNKPILIAPLSEPGWQLLSLDMADRMRKGGLLVSRIIGHQADVYMPEENIDGTYPITGYDGHRYYSDSLVFPASKIQYIWGLDPERDEWKKSMKGE